MVITYCGDSGFDQSYISMNIMNQTFTISNMESV